MLMNEDFNKYYDWKNNLVQFDIIKSRLNSLGQKLNYSKKLISVIQSCLEKDEHERASILSLHRLLNDSFLNKDIEVAPLSTSEDPKTKTIDNHELYS